MNNKGFTLIELLAVIMILAVLVLIGTSSILPLVERARKTALSEEGINLVYSAKTVYRSEVLLGAKAKYQSTNTVCFSLDYLRVNGYFEKGEDYGYKGSVEIISKGDGNYEYHYWITNGTYMVLDSTSTEVEEDDVIEYNEATAKLINTCGYNTTTGKPEDNKYDYYCNKKTCKEV